jgi:hypothetical protein
MKWYRKLILGDNAKNQKYKIVGKVRTGKFQIDTYLIALPSNPQNLLDIYHANFLLQPHFKKTHVLDNIYVLGIAKGREEAFEVVQGIIAEVYENTGGFQIRKYYKFGQSKI